MTTQLFFVFRWIHVVFAAAWLGLVVVLNFVVLPGMAKLPDEYRIRVIKNFFPRIFRLASTLAGITAISGGVLLYHFVGFDIGNLFNMGSWGISIFIGGILGLLLALFHFFMERKLSRKLISGNQHHAQSNLEDVHLKIKIIPRIGLLVLLFIFLLMLNSTHPLILF